MNQREEDKVCDWAIHLVEDKYTQAQLDELKRIHDLRITIVEMKLECCV